MTPRTDAASIIQSSIFDRRSAITHVWIDHFRNHTQWELQTDAQPVVLIGRNGAGKTNILEALSLFAPGRGLRKSALRDMDNAEAKRPWSVAIRLQQGSEEHQLGTGRDTESRTDKRIIKINGTRERQQSVLCDYVSILWLTPQMDTLFLEGNTARRKFLDRLVYAFDPAHVVRVTEYEHAMRERNKLLRSMSPDAQWLDVLEERMAAQAVAITIARLDCIARLAHAMESHPHRFIAAELRVNGAVEQWLAAGVKAIDAEAQLAEEMRLSRRLDAAIGRAMVGCHRSRFTLIHKDKNREAAECSTGEQKRVLLGLLLTLANARVFEGLSPPVLLLDEVVAHLDVEHRKELFDAMLEGGMQTWMTGTDAADFCGLEGHATWIDVAGGTARRMD